MAQYHYCPRCGKEIPAGASYCPSCGGYQASQVHTKSCKHCGQTIDKECVVCPKCGKQVSELKSEQPQVVINNSNNNVNTNINGGGRRRKEINKWLAFCLCLFLGFIGAHRFYEGKIGTGILYIFTFGLFGIGILVDLIIILTKPNPYYV